MLMADVVDPSGTTSHTTSLWKGVHLKQISLPEARRRKGYATRIIKRLLVDARAAGHDYLFIESVLSEGLHALIQRLPEFVAVPSQPNCYIAVLATRTPAAENQ